MVRTEILNHPKANRKTHEAKKAISRTLGLAKIDCHMDFFAIWIRGAVSTSTDVRSDILKMKKKEIGQSRNNKKPVLVEGEFSTARMSICEIMGKSCLIPFLNHPPSNVRGHHPRKKKKPKRLFPRSREAESRGFSPERCKNVEAKTSADKCGAGP